jgi:hypothetical protein
MQTYQLTYDLTSGFVHDWLILGPYSTPSELPGHAEQSLEERWTILAHSRPAQPPVDQPPTQLDKIRVGDTEVFWKLEHVQADHRLERSLYAVRCAHAQLWAFCHLSSETARTVTATLNSTCPAAIWLNGQACSPSEPVGSKYNPGSLPEVQWSLNLELAAGENQLLVLLEDIGQHELTLSAQLQLSPTAGLRVVIPVLSPEVEYWHKVEHVYTQIHLDRAVYTSPDSITLLGPVDQSRQVSTTVRIQKTSGEIYGEYMLPLLSSESFTLIPANQLPSGDYQAVLMPPANLYYESMFRPSRAMPFRVVNEALFLWAEMPYVQRLALILQSAERRGGMAGQVASLTMGHTNRVNENVIRSALHSVVHVEAGCLMNLLNLWLVKALADQQPGPPILTAKLRTDIESAMTGFGYSAMPFPRNEEQMLRYACQALAGQAYPDVHFPSEGNLTGRDVQKLAESQAVEWLRKHAVWGFENGDPDPEVLVPALAVLAEYSDDEPAAELAAVFLDKLFFSLATRAWNGYSDPTGARLPAYALKSTRQLPGSALGLLMWGQGMLQTDLSAAVILASCAGYELPEVIQAIAYDPSEPTWTVERNRVPGSATEASLYSNYKTQAYRLSSIHFNGTQCSCACQPHAWQATMGPEAVVFSSDPGGFSQSPYRLYGYWRGNSRCPDAGQWKDSLICRYNASQTSQLGFTHAYFPVQAFDETRIAGRWAFARAGDAYLALYAEQGLELALDGEDAGHELRSSGSIWVCQMGQRSEDGAFDDFCQRNLSNEPRISGERVWWQTIREDELLLDADGQFHINGEPHADERPITSPYASLERGAKIMTIQHQSLGLELNFD